MKAKLFVGKMSRRCDLTAPRNCHAYYMFELKLKDDKYIFTAQGELWNHLQTNLVMGGQCLPDLRKHLRAHSELYDIWKRYHLNDMHAGTPEQEAALPKPYTTYEAACQHLKEQGLLTVEHDGKPYTYGEGWLYEAIPADVVARIKELAA